MGAGTSLTYVIGDIHGRLDLLTTLLAQIEHHRAGRDRTIVFLGDYIDRGPDSASVVATVRKLQARDVVPSIERAATWHLAGSEALARGTRSLINRAEERPLKRVERAVGGEEAEAAVFANDDARRPLANLNNVG
jgi:Calcineurin-like phosphoesterase